MSWLKCRSNHKTTEIGKMSIKHRQAKSSNIINMIKCTIHQSKLLLIETGKCLSNIKI